MASQVGFGPRAIVRRTLIDNEEVRCTHHCRSPKPTLNGCDLTPSTGEQSSEQEYGYLTVSKRHLSTLCSHNTPQSFSTGPRAMYFPEVSKTCVYVFGMIPGFLENSCKCGNLFCSAAAATKSALGIIQLWFNYFGGILAYTLSGRLCQAMPRSFVYSLLSPFFCVWGWFNHYQAFRNRH